MYKIIEPITFYKSTYDSHFKQSSSWKLFLKDPVDRMSVNFSFVSSSAKQIWEGELREETGDVNLN